MGLPAKSIDELVREHAAWVRGIAAGVARELRLMHAMDDLVGFAQAGLLEALERHDAQGSVPFQAFAYYRVRGAALDGSYKLRGTTRNALVAALQANDARLEEKGAAHTARPAPDRTEAALVDLNGLIHGIVDSHALAEIVEDERSGEEPIIAALDRERIRRAVERLPDRERQVIDAVYFGDAALDDIGAKLGVSRSQASRLHTRGLALLREHLS